MPQRQYNTGKKRVAIVGTGMSGEITAFCLNQYAADKVTIETIYEAGARPGLHVNSLAVEGVKVDMPLRASSPHYYPNLMRLYKKLGIPLEDVDYSSTQASFSPNKAFFRYYNVLVFGLALPFVWLDSFTSLTTLYMAFQIIRDLLWFVFTGPYFLYNRRAEMAVTPLGKVLTQQGYSHAFIHRFLYPLMSVLLSCSYDQVDKYPANYIMEFYSARNTTIFTGWRRVTNAGIEEVSNKLLSGIPESVFRFNNPVKSVTPLNDGADGIEVIDSKGDRQVYDIVIIATEPSIAAKIWNGKTAQETELLSCIDTYTANIMVHRDTSLMPNSRSEWSGLNIMSMSATSSVTKDLLTDRFTASMISGRLQYFNSKVKEDHLFETWNSYRQPDESLIVKDTTMTRSVWTAEGAATFVELFGEVQGKRDVYLVGSYCSPGVTLLEQAASSGLRVAQKLGAELPFRVYPTYEATWWTLVLSHVLVLGRTAVVMLLEFAIAAATLVGTWTGVSAGLKMMW